MKTFIVNALKEYENINKKLDSVCLLQNKEWTVFTDQPNIIEKYLFLKKSRLINSINGVSACYTWEYFPVNSSILIDNGVSKLLFRVVVSDEKILILNLDGTQEFCFLINTSESNNKLLTYEDIQWYLMRNCNVDILSEQQKIEFEEEKRNKEELWRLEQEKERKEDEEFVKILIFVVIGVIVIISILVLISRYV